MNAKITKSRTETKAACLTSAQGARGALADLQGQVVRHVGLHMHVSPVDAC